MVELSYAQIFVFSAIIMVPSIFTLLLVARLYKEQLELIQIQEKTSMCLLRLSEMGMATGSSIEHLARVILTDPGRRFKSGEMKYRFEGEEE